MDGGVASGVAADLTDLLKGSRLMGSRGDAAEKGLTEGVLRHASGRPLSSTHISAGRPPSLDCLQQRDEGEMVRETSAASWLVRRRSD